uniref:RNA-dependent RNA polymerase n=1 Tax=Anisakis simplex TaxID=6269 RepID=A0A0M3J9U4_ANISI
LQRTVYYDDKDDEGPFRQRKPTEDIHHQQQYVANKLNIERETFLRFHDDHQPEFDLRGYRKDSVISRNDSDRTVGTEYAGELIEICQHLFPVTEEKMRRYFRRLMGSFNL